MWTQCLPFDHAAPPAHAPLLLLFLQPATEMQHPVARACGRLARLDVLATAGADRIGALLAHGVPLTELVDERPAPAVVTEIEPVVDRNRSLDVTNHGHDPLLRNGRLHRYAAEAQPRVHHGYKEAFAFVIHGRSERPAP